MKITHIYKDYYPVLGGIENHIKALTEYQAARGHTVTVLTCNRGLLSSEEILSGVGVVRAGRLCTTASMPISPALIRKFLTLEHEVVHVHSPFPLGEFGTLLSHAGRRLVCTWHSDIVRQKKLLKVYAPFLKAFLRRVDLVIATSPEYLESSEWISGFREKAMIVPLGVDTEHFKPAGRPSGDREPLVLFSGKLRHYKGVDVLLQAVPLVQEARFVVVGDGPERQRLVKLAGRLGLGERVQFSGQVSDEQLLTLYREASVFVLPSTSRAEAFGTVLLEAMACGVPCVSTELGTATSIVNVDGETGLVVPANDCRALASAINKLLGDQELRTQYAATARSRVTGTYSSEKLFQQITDAYL